MALHAQCVYNDVWRTDLPSKMNNTRETRNTMTVRLTTIRAHPLKVLSKHS